MSDYSNRSNKNSLQQSKPRQQMRENTSKRILPIHLLRLKLLGYSTREYLDRDYTL